MKEIKTSSTIATGLAMFSMFFGAGNVVFPLALGQYAQDKNGFAILGLLLTAVGVPFIGLIAMSLFNGNYRHFFERIGKVPGFILAILIMGLIGPFGATPRTIALSFSTIQIYFPSLSLPYFSLAACILIFLLTFRRTNIVDILGYFLTPVLLLSLGAILCVGLFMGPTAPHNDASSLSVFTSGFVEGYKTMDLMGAFFFSSVVLVCLKKELHPSKHDDYKLLTMMSLKASCIGAGLLGVVYVGFSTIASFYSESLAGYGKDKMIAVIAREVLGPYGGIFASLAVSLACLTTAIALVAVFAEFIHKDICNDKIKFRTALILTIVSTYLVSILNFATIALFLEPILIICYPALIAISVLNLLYKFFQFKPMKTPVAIVFLLSLLGVIL